MIDKSELEESLKSSICASIRLEQRGVDRYMVHTGYTFGDGDEIHIILKRDGDGWILTDEGHTVMWLSYEDLILTDSRMEALAGVLAYNSAEYRDGRIVVDCHDRPLGGCLQSMIQAILQAADLLFLKRENVRSTFAEDVKGLIGATYGDCRFDERLENGNESYVIDAYVPGSRPILAFAVGSKEKCIMAAFTILALSKEKEMPFTSLVIVDRAAKLSRGDLDLITNRSDKLFMGSPAIDDPDFRRFVERNPVEGRADAGNRAVYAKRTRKGRGRFPISQLYQRENPF
jgi:hypothetical protein